MAAIFNPSEYMSLISDMNRNRKMSFLSMVIVAIIVLLQRFLLLSEISDSFEGTDFIRWLLMTISIPLLLIVLGMMMNVDLSGGDKFGGLFESMAMTVAIVVSLFFVYDFLGFALTVAILIIFSFGAIILVGAFYSIAAKTS